MAEASTNKAPGDYLGEIQQLKTKVKGIASGDTVKGVATGAGIGVVIGIGYSILYKKSLFKGGMFGALIGSALSFTLITTKTSKK